MFRNFYYFKNFNAEKLHETILIFIMQIKDIIPKESYFHAKQERISTASKMVKNTKNKNL